MCSTVKGSSHPMHIGGSSSRFIRNVWVSRVCPMCSQASTRYFILGQKRSYFHVSKSLLMTTCIDCKSYSCPLQHPLTFLLNISGTKTPLHPPKSVFPRTHSRASFTHKNSESTHIFSDPRVLGRTYFQPQASKYTKGRSLCYTRASSARNLKGRTSS